MNIMMLVIGGAIGVAALWLAAMAWTKLRAGGL